MADLDAIERPVADVLAAHIGDQPVTVAAVDHDGRRTTRHGPDPATALARLTTARSTP